MTARFKIFQADSFEKVKSYFRKEKTGNSHNEHKEREYQIGRGQPFQAACRRGANTFHAPGLFTRIIPATVSPRKTSRANKRFDLLHQKLIFHKEKEKILFPMENPYII